MINKKICIGIFFENKLQDGGGFNQSITDSIKLEKACPAHAEIKFYTIYKKNIEILKQLGIKAKLINLSKYKKLKDILIGDILQPILNKLKIRFNYIYTFEKLFLKDKIDLIYFTSPNFRAIQLREISFILTIWDLCHIDHPEFPEIKLNQTFEKRNQFYKIVIPKASAIIRDSEISKNKISKNYLIEERKIFIFPFTTPKIFSENDEFEDQFLKIHNLKKPYIFYPAQYWPHKNHIYILDALKVFKKKYQIYLECVFCGSEKGNLKYLKKYCRELNLENQVRFLGFVNNKVLKTLYKNSLVLVMPTYFGPTNIPPLEAFQMGIPVIYSQLSGLKDQVKDAALLTDLSDPESLADNINLIIHNDKLRKNLIKKGKERLKQINQSHEMNKFISYLNEFYSKRRCWE